VFSAGRRWRSHSACAFHKRMASGMLNQVVLANRLRTLAVVQVGTARYSFSRSWPLHRPAPPTVFDYDLPLRDVQETAELQPWCVFFHVIDTEQAVAPGIALTMVPLAHTVACADSPFKSGILGCLAPGPEWRVNRRWHFRRTIRWSGSREFLAFLDHNGSNQPPSAVSPTGRRRQICCS